MSKRIYLPNWGVCDKWFYMMYKYCRILWYLRYGRKWRAVKIDMEGKYPPEIVFVSK